MRMLGFLPLVIAFGVAAHAQDELCSRDAQVERPVYGAGEPFSLSGKIAGHEGKMMRLCTVENQTLVVIDSVEVKRGAFLLAGKINLPLPVVLKLDEGNTLPFILEPAKLEVRVNPGSFEDSEVMGGASGKFFAEAYRQLADYRARLRHLDERYQRYLMLGVQNQQLYDQLNAAQARITGEQLAAAKQLVAQNPTQLAAATIMASHLANLPQEELEPLFNSLSPLVRSQLALRPIDARLNADRVVAIGSTFIDVALPAPDGSTVRLSDFAAKGRYTLLMFWASWCSHCQQEIPEVVDLYNRYKGRGLEIFAVSGDTDKAAWVAKIAEAQMDFTHASELRGFDSEAFRRYYVQAIPLMLLLDGEGRIVAKGNLNQGIKAKVDEVFAGL